MNSNQFKIMVALVARGDEDPVIKQAAFYVEKLQARLTAIHVNQPALSQPKGAVEQRVTEEMIRDRFITSGFENILNNTDIIIEYGENVSKIISTHSGDMDLIILGHRKMNTFKSRIMDSIDEGISNLVACPVLVVQKN
jgi:nucleotide-binding universal stress UspA family protein